VPVDGFLLAGEKPKVKPPNEIRPMVLAGAQGLELAFLNVTVC